MARPCIKRNPLQSRHVRELIRAHGRASVYTAFVLVGPLRQPVMVSEGESGADIEAADGYVQESLRKSLMVSKSLGL